MCSPSKRSIGSPVEHPEADLIFSDEDRIDTDGKRFGVQFKPAWNPAMMLSTNAFGRLGVFRKSLIERLAAFARVSKSVMTTIWC
jgi:hypothetical protein